MKHLYLSLTFILLGMLAVAQKPAITWGDEFKFRKGSTDLQVVFADQNSVYLQESHLALKGYYVFAATTRESASLVKMDKDLKEVYRNDFNKELRGKEFVQFFTCEDKLFLFSSDYSRPDKTLTLYAAAIDKQTGELTGEWKEVANYQKEEKNDDIEFKLSYNTDSTRMIIVSSVQRSERNEYKIQELDKNLKTAAKPIKIKNGFEAKKYRLEDLLYTNDHKVILVGRMYEYEEGKKKKEKFLDFTNYNIRIYNEKGKQQTEINTTINGKWLSSTKLIQEKNKDLVLAAFYSKQKKGKTIDGLLVQRINVADGKVISTSDKPINHSLLSADNNFDEEEDKDESREERKMREEIRKAQDEGEGFSKYMQFRQIFYTADNGLVILAEQYHQYTYTTQSYSAGSSVIPGQMRSTTRTNYLTDDLMMCKVDAAGNISWLQVLPKDQYESIQTSSSSGSGLSFSNSFFMNGGRPFYSGFGAMQTGGTIHILFNDNPKNAQVMQAGQKAKTAERFSKSDCFILNVDEISGKFTRKVFFNNAGVPTAMPRLGAVIGNEMYMVGKTDKLLGKSKIAVARITIK
ncbi:hypothetical protein [Chitinophaga nivalis]|uniref:Uncharacterized protein n=1 Tax=Chitinophaga nivalis TaxID=2991709 RepID=A0ABT3ITZ5_9BACT|nr:hypothetical protein [Chitinophaga nivalis]MCW3462848.1 hypothetical protein [Chitinophaga nivalis]MCW3487462.1 hypothetical protein [Chitinophaga nivalis]